MAVIVKDNGKDFERIEPGLHQAVCSHVIDLGLQDTKYGPKRKIALCFELADLMQDGRPFMQSKIYGASLNEKANLRHDLESWRGKKFAEEEVGGFDVEVLIGVNCMLNIVEETKGDKTYTNISAVIKCPTGTQKIAPVNQPAPEWLCKKAEDGIKRATEWDEPIVPADDIPPPHSDADFVPEDLPSMEPLPF